MILIHCKDWPIKIRPAVARCVVSSWDQNKEKLRVHDGSKTLKTKHINKQASTSRTFVSRNAL